MALERQSLLIDLADDGIRHSSVFRQCLLSLQSGAIGRAEALCWEALRSACGNAHLLHLLGMILVRQGGSRKPPIGSPRRSNPRPIRPRFIMIAASRLRGWRAMRRRWKATTAPLLCVLAPRQTFEIRCHQL